MVVVVMVVVMLAAVWFAVFRQHVDVGCRELASVTVAPNGFVLRPAQLTPCSAPGSDLEVVDDEFWQQRAFRSGTTVQRSACLSVQRSVCCSGYVLLPVTPAFHNWKNPIGR